MSDETLEAIRRAYEAFGSRDLGAILDAMHEDVEFDATGAMAHRGVFHGHAGIAQYLATLGDTWDSYELDIDETTPSLSGHAMVVGRMRGVERSTGDRVEAPFIHVLRVKRGKVCRVQVYVDRDHAMREMHRQATLVSATRSG